MSSNNKGKCSHAMSSLERKNNKLILLVEARGDWGIPTNELKETVKVL